MRKIILSIQCNRKKMKSGFILISTVMALTAATVSDDNLTWLVVTTLIVLIFLVH